MKWFVWFKKKKKKKAEDFCDDSNHHKDVPTKHNVLCHERSVWDVIQQHAVDFAPVLDDSVDVDDVESSTDHPDDVATPFSPPQFHYIAPTAARYVLLLDRSQMMAKSVIISKYSIRISIQFTWNQIHLKSNSLENDIKRIESMLKWDRWRHQRHLWRPTQNMNEWMNEWFNWNLIPTESVEGVTTGSFTMDPLADGRHRAEHRGVGWRHGRRRSLGHPRLDAGHRPQPRRSHRPHPTTTFNLCLLRQNSRH